MPEELVMVIATTSVLEGEIARARLEEEGIPVLVQGGADGPYRLGPVRLFVPAGLEVQARLALTAGSAPVDDGRDADGLQEGGSSEGPGTAG